MGNAAADYSRYLPRNASTKGVVWWTTFGSSIAPLILLLFGLLLAGSSHTFTNDVNGSVYGPVGALATILPTWFLVPFAIVAILGLVGGAVLDIYSSGLSLLSAGLKIPRYAAAGVDGVIMMIGTVYIVFVSGNFIYQFEGFLITVGVLIAAWCGVFLADLLLRRRTTPTSTSTALRVATATYDSSLFSPSSSRASLAGAWSPTLTRTG